MIAIALLLLAVISGEATEGNASTGGQSSPTGVPAAAGRDGRRGDAGVRRVALGRGAGRPLDFTDARVMKSWLQEQAALVIREGAKSLGGSTLMPAHGDRLSANEISDLVAFIGSLRR